MNIDNTVNYKNFDMNKYKGVFKVAAIVIGCVILLSILFNLCFFSVDEREQAVVTQFNKIIRIVVGEGDAKLKEEVKGIDVITGKGIFFKIPFIQKVKYYTDLKLVYDTDAREVTTLDKKQLVLDNYVIWEIDNPALFAAADLNQISAQSRIEDILYSKLNEEIGKVNAHVVIGDKQYVEDMLKRTVVESNEHMQEFGVRVVDIRIKRTDLPQETYNNIFNRMRTERERAARTYRSEGQEEAQKIRSNADKQCTIIEAQAYEQAERIRGEGDAEALAIYAEAYNKDPEFYEFWRTLEAYKKTLSGNTTIVIDSDSPFAKYLFGIE
ncbi:MAG TPA: protease modulator HflC [Clostridiaceae bacterium]|jgi:membrane protease subunit HflC|nr:protease modulator HflC [Clostridiaceae bacterium]